MINSIDKFKMRREFIIMINSDVFKNLLSKFKGGAHVGKNRSVIFCACATRFAYADLT